MTNRFNLNDKTDSFFASRVIDNLNRSYKLIKHGYDATFFIVTEFYITARKTHLSERRWDISDLAS